MGDYVELGKVSGFFGVKGWLKLFSFARPREGLIHYQNFLVGESKTPVVFEHIKVHGKSIIGNISGVSTREDAEKYIGKILYVKREDLPTLDNEYYWHDLIGLNVINQQGVCLGQIVEMMETGANDVMVIRNASAEETLIPFALSHFVLSVNLDEGEVRVDWETDKEQ